METVDTELDTRRLTPDLSFLDNIIMDCKGMRCEDMMGQVHDQWQSFHFSSSISYGSTINSPLVTY